MGPDIKLLDEAHIMLYHDSDQFFEGGLLRIPAQEAFGLRRVAQQLVDLSGTEVLRVDFNEHLARGRVDTFLVHAFAFPAQVDTRFLES